MDEILSVSVWGAQVCLGKESEFSSMSTTCVNT